MSNLEQLSLFGDDFDIKIPEKSVKDVVKKATKKVDAEIDPEKALKSKKLALQERLAIINSNVLRILGKQKNNVIVIKDKATFDNYISNAIKAGRIAIDTETNNSLDPITCKIAGLCLYYPGGKQAYIPVNHRNPETKERLSWQMTEEDCREELEKINDSKIKQIFHNGKFDYEVLKCTCNVKVNPYWDTIVGARLLNENEPAGLKWQYVNKIDPSQEKYDIDHLFENVSYLDVDPEIFALYSATDSMMTDKLYELQVIEFEKEEYGPHLDISGKHEVKGLRWLFHEIEMPITVITAEMELTGVKVDTKLGERLKLKYNNELTKVDSKINEILDRVKPLIDSWLLTEEANKKTIVYVAKKSKMSREKIEATYPNVDENGNRFKYGKAKAEQLSDPINLASPVQLAILFFDILGAPLPEDGSRATGEDELKAISDDLTNVFVKKISDKKIKEPKDLDAVIKLCKLILERRGIVKLITTYIDVIPELSQHWPDGRIRFHLNSLGTDTGRYSSGGKIKYMENDVPIEVSGINIQNIPSHNPEIRLLFVGDLFAKLNESADDEHFIVDEFTEVEMESGWKYCQDISVGENILVNSNSTPIKSINYDASTRKYCLGV